LAPYWLVAALHLKATTTLVQQTRRQPTLSQIAPQLQMHQLVTQLHLQEPTPTSLLATQRHLLATARHLLATAKHLRATPTSQQILLQQQTSKYLLFVKNSKSSSTWETISLF
jgi:hypothetical protein